MNLINYSLTTLSPPRWSQYCGRRGTRSVALRGQPAQDPTLHRLSDRLLACSGFSQNLLQLLFLVRSQRLGLMSRQNLFDPGIEPLAQGCASGLQPLRANLAIQQAGEKSRKRLSVCATGGLALWSCAARARLELTHAHIVEALRARDVAAARQAMLDEISETREMMVLSATW